MKGSFTGLLLGLGLLVSGSTLSLYAQAQGVLEKIRVHGPSLEGNLAGDDATRDVYVYLPPGYEDSPASRYPVVYFLHGYSAIPDTYLNFTEVPESINAAIADGVEEMIWVFPDGNSSYSGSMYSNSLTTGDWESYIATDLVDYIDGNYRTLADRQHRGLSGHSMGGYGTMRVAMKRPEVFSAIYAMSSCCLMNQAPGREAVEQQEARMAQGPVDASAGFANVLQAQAAAWAPNPENPPYYFDWPFVDGEAQPLVQAKWIANSPLVMVDQYVPALRSFDGLMLDIGDEDTLLATNVQLDQALTRLGVEHGFEIYEGDHVNRIGLRFRQNVMPFFSQLLND